MTLSAWSAVARLYGYRVSEGLEQDGTWYAWDGATAKGYWDTDTHYYLQWVRR